MKIIIFKMYVILISLFFVSISLAEDSLSQEYKEEKIFQIGSESILRKELLPDDEYLSQEYKEEKIFQIGSELILRKELLPDDECFQQQKAKMSPNSFRNFLKMYQMKSAFHVVNNKLIKYLCENSDCTLDEKSVTEFYNFIEFMRNDFLSRQDEDFIDFNDEDAKKRWDEFSIRVMGGGPDIWKANKILYEKYGGRVYQGNISAPTPLEARYKYFLELEKEGVLKFYDQEARKDIIEFFNWYMKSAKEIDEEYFKRHHMKHPWEFPFWRFDLKRNRGRSPS